MLTLDTLNVMLAVSEEGLIEETIVTLLASPQLVGFFKKFPRLKNALAEVLPRWRSALKARFRETHVPQALSDEVACYQKNLTLSTSQFIIQLPQILAQLDRVRSPFAAQAQQLVSSNPRFTAALHTLFLPRASVRVMPLKSIFRVLCFFTSPITNTFRSSLRGT